MILTSIVIATKLSHSQRVTRYRPCTRMRRRGFITPLGVPGPKMLVKLVAAAILCLADVHAEAAEIRDGETGYVANNSIWFTDESDLSVWKRVREAFAPKDVKTY